MCQLGGIVIEAAPVRYITRWRSGGRLVGEDSLLAEMSVSDPGELRSLREYLRRIPGVDVDQAPGAPGEGELGVWDVLQVTAVGSGALAVAVRTLPAFIRSRRSSVTVTVKTAGKTVTVTAQNIDEAMPIVEKALDA